MDGLFIYLHYFVFIALMLFGCIRSWNFVNVVLTCCCQNSLRLRQYGHSANFWIHANYWLTEFESLRETSQLCVLQISRWKTCSLINMTSCTKSHRVNREILTSFWDLWAEPNSCVVKWYFMYLDMGQKIKNIYY